VGYSPAVQNDTARIISLEIGAGSSYCLSFYYFMKGKHIEALNIYTSNYDNESLIWTKIGNQGDSWLNGKVNIFSGFGNFKIIIEGVRGISYLVYILIFLKFYFILLNNLHLIFNLKGHISIDDISLQDGYCSNNELLNCDFEKDLCGFEHDFTAKTKWIRTFGRNVAAVGSTGIY
jgi:hypothetical protein